jgi:type IV secretory pathway VirB10-like protein
MSSRAARIDTGVGVSFITSAVIHLAVFLLLVFSGGLIPRQFAIQETYYVDMVTLPTAAPEPGSPAQESEAASQPANPPLPTPPVVAQPPARSAPKAPASTAKPSPQQEPAVTDSDFAERMAKLESSTEARREAEVLAKLRSKVKAAAPAKVGTPGTSGAEAGVRYADYIKSRLEDALKVTIRFDPTKKNPEVAVRLIISAEGKLSKKTFEREGDDSIFFNAVKGAIELASEKFPPPPNRTAFESGFVFRPKGIARAQTR